jgi:enoyl-CoA hydratase
MAGEIVCEIRDRVAYLTLDRSDDGNRLTAGMAAALVEACETIEDSGATAVTVRGAGGWFCAGLASGVDPAALGGHRDPVAAVARLTRPVIAVLDGAAIGPGAELALACDLRLAADGATLSFPEVRAGRLPCFGATQRLPRLIGRAKALEVLLLGATIAAPDARRLGLVTRAVPAAELDAAVGDVLAALTSRAPLALAAAKEAIVRAADLSLADGMRLEEDLYVLLQTTVDRAEGVRSFVERRPPRFRGT